LPRKNCKKRLIKRLKDKKSDSSVGYNVYKLAKKNFEGIKEKDFIIDSSKDIDKQIKKLVFEFGIRN